MSKQWRCLEKSQLFHSSSLCIANTYKRTTGDFGSVKQLAGSFFRLAAENPLHYSWLVKKTKVFSVAHGDSNVLI